MIYVAFIFWMFALLCLTRGIVRMWVEMIGPRPVGFILLPGTIVSELSFYLACLLSGAEFRPRKLLESAAAEGKGGGGGGGKAQPAAVGDLGGAPYITPVLTSLLPLVAALGLVWIICRELNHPALGASATTMLTIKLPPMAGQTLWTLLNDQVSLMQATWSVLSSTLLHEPWNKSAAVAMHYLVACLVLRMAPARLGSKQALLGMALFSMGAALAAAIISSSGQILRNLWPLLSFAWGVCLLLLTATLIIKGCSALSKIFID